MVRLEEIEEELKNQRVFNRQVASRADLEMKFGKNAPFSPRTRMDAAQARLDQLEKEILGCGNYSNAGEVVALHEILFSLYRDYFGAASPNYLGVRDRCAALLEALLKHGLCRSEDLLGPLPQDQDPLTGRVVWRSKRRKILPDDQM